MEYETTWQIIAEHIPAVEEFHFLDNEFLLIQYNTNGKWLFAIAGRHETEFILVASDGFRQVYAEDLDGYWHPVEEGIFFRPIRQGDSIAIYRRNSADDDFSLAGEMKLNN